MEKRQSRFSWYFFNGQPHQLIIGPSGHGDKQWMELGPVLTPEPRWRNGFYMEAECSCVMNREGLEQVFTPSDRGAGRIYYVDINYEVPDYSLYSDMEIVRKVQEFSQKLMGAKHGR